MALPDFSDHPVKERRRRVSLGSETSLCSEHLCPKHLGLGVETSTVCGSDEWQIDLHEE